MEYTIDTDDRLSKSRKLYLKEKCHCRLKLAIDDRKGYQSETL